MKTYNQILYSAMVACLSFTTANAATVFNADFEGSTVGIDNVTKVNLDAGTSTGSWTVGDAQESDMANPNGSSTRWLYADLGQYDFTANFASAGNLTLGNATVDFDFTMARLAADRNHVWTVGNASTVGVQLRALYVNATNAALQYWNGSIYTELGTNLLNNGGTTAGLADLQSISIVLSETNYDVFVGAAEVGSNLSYVNAITSVDRLNLSGENGASGAFYDNISVDAVPVPEPSSALLIVLGGLGLFLRRRK